MNLFFLLPTGHTRTVTLSGENLINDTNTDPTASYAGIRVNTDGTIDKRVGATYTQIDASTDWIIPNGDASSLYEVYLVDNNANVDAGSDSTATWLALSTNREWYVAVTSPGSKNFDFDLSIRYNGGSTLDTANYLGNATVDP